MDVDAGRVGGLGVAVRTTSGSGVLVARGVPKRITNAVGLGPEVGWEMAWVVVAAAPPEVEPGDEFEPDGISVEETDVEPAVGSETAVCVDKSSMPWSTESPSKGVDVSVSGEAMPGSVPISRYLNGVAVSASGAAL